MRTVITHLLNSRFWENPAVSQWLMALSTRWQIFKASHYWSVMSSMTGPSFEPDLPRTTLPTEVVTVSMYSSPIMLSWTTWLELTLEMLGVDTSPMDKEPTGISRPTSMTSGVFRQAITLVKPQGGVGGCFNANALAGGGDASSDGAFDKQSGRIIGIVRVSCQVPPFNFGIVAGLGISPVANTSWDGCNIFSHLAYFEVFFTCIGFSIGCTSGTSIAPGISATGVTLAVVGTMGLLSSFLGRSTPLKTSSSMKDR